MMYFLLSLPLFLSWQVCQGQMEFESTVLFLFDANETTCEISACSSGWGGNSARVCHSKPVSDADSYSWILREGLYCSALSAMGCTYDELVFRDIEYCDSLDWQTVDSCYAGCSCDSSEEGTEQYVTYSDQTSKECHKCTCQSFNSNNEFAWTCEEINQINSYEKEFEYFTCPEEETKTCSYDGSTFNAYESWFTETESISTEFSYTTFCVCTGKGTVACVSGFANIKNNANAYPYFLSECGEWIGPCLDSDDPDTAWVAANSNTCPKCSCDQVSSYATDGTNATFVYASVDESSWQYEYTCRYNCECESSDDYESDVFGYGSCDGWPWDNGYSYDDDVPWLACPSDFYCYTGSNRDPWVCSKQSASKYCGKFLYEDVFVWGEKTFAVQNSRLSDCQDSWKCQLIKSSDAVQPWNAEYNQTDCRYWNITIPQVWAIADCDNPDESRYSMEVSVKNYLQCCDDGIACQQNYEIEESKCVEANSDFQDVMIAIHSCQQSEKIISGPIGLDKYCWDDWKDEYDNCGYMEAETDFEVGCHCFALSKVYDSVTSDIQTSMNLFMEDLQSKMETWYSTYGCSELTVTCDLAAGEYNGMSESDFYGGEDAATSTKCGVVLFLSVLCIFLLLH